MKVLVMADGDTLDSPVSAVFARAPYYLIVDTDTWEVEATLNPAVGAAGGAGVQAAQFAASKGVQAVIAGRVGPNALGALQAANIPVYVTGPTTVKDAVQAFVDGKLTQYTAVAPQPPAYGWGYGAGFGYGRGGYGPGYGPGYGMGYGRGGRGRGRRGRGGRGGWW